MRRSLSRSTPLLFLLLAAVALLLAFAGVAAAAEPSTVGNWWDVVPEVEVPSPFYDSILYSEIAPDLREIEMSSNRVKVDVIGQSAGGRNLFLVTISDPQAMGRLGQYKAISNQMLKDPAKAQAMIEKFGDFKVPVFINGSIHGGEYPGTDTAMRLIEQFAYSNDPEVLEVLKNEILLINVCQNPDGRVLGTRDNANGIDINRDFYTQSQPESRITAGLLADWNPMILLDLHGFVDPMLIEPCTPPHNPNYEYDLYIKWALAQAEAMEANLFANTGFLAQIPYRDFDWVGTTGPRATRPCSRCTTVPTATHSRRRTVTTAVWTRSTTRSGAHSTSSPRTARRCSTTRSRSTAEASSTCRSSRFRPSSFPCGSSSPSSCCRSSRRRG